MKFKFCVSQDESMKLGQIERKENAIKAFKTKKVQLLGEKVKIPLGAYSQDSIRVSKK